MTRFQDRARPRRRPADNGSFWLLMEVHQFVTDTEGTATVTLRAGSGQELLKAVRTNRFEQQMRAAG